MSKLSKITLAVGLILILILSASCKGDQPQPCAFDELEASECYDSGGIYDYDNCTCN
ncbi:MAG: hypothetical protein AAF804_12540 [Bacteroidota bacterium]